MSMSFGLGANLKLGTSQKLTPQMQQAIKLLQMSSIELEQEVQIQLDKNPMLEREESGEDALDNILDSADSLDNNLEQLNNLSTRTDKSGSDDNEFSVADDGFSERQTADTFDKLSDGSCDDSVVDANWDNVYTSEPSSMARADTSELGEYLGSTSATIQDHIRWQINFKNLSAIDNMIADYLIDSMDEAGFITLDLEELHSSLATIASFYQWEKSIDKEDINMVLHLIQSCEPNGIGARDLAECLLLQLKKVDKHTPYIKEAEQLLGHCEYLKTNNISALLATTGLAVDEIEPALQLLRTLNPAPGVAFTDSQPDYGLFPESYDIPDVLVTMMYEDVYTDTINSHKTTDDNTNHENNDQNNANQGKDSTVTWHVRLNPDTLPKLKINQEYACLVKRGDDSPNNTYLKDNLNDAKLFIRSIQERNHNLLKVATEIVKRQEQFLLQGATAMQPLILREVAERVGLHESTVSRLTTSKSILTPQGLFSLKHFFSSSVSGIDGDVSSTAICAMIQGFIDNENPKKPMSDNAIVKELNKEGIDIARRTVAKYREAMNIGSSTQRKQRY